MGMETKHIHQSLPLSVKDVGTQRSDGKSGKLTMEVKKEQVKVKEEPESPSMGPGLGIGADDNNSVIEREKSTLTASQLRELKQQALIFKYMVAGRPVPIDLVLHIWRSVAGSFGSANGDDIYTQFPSFVGLSPQGFDNTNMMDPEPGRCRRTDGKKWRCSKNVVPDQKYCERHMHRGRERSRKRVEASLTAAVSAISPTKNLSMNSENSNTSYTNLSPVNSQVKSPSPNNASISCKTAGITGSNADIRITGTTMTAGSLSDQKSTTVTMTASAIASHGNTAKTMITAAIHKDTSAAGMTITNDKSSNISINGHVIDGGNRNWSNAVSYPNIINRSCNRGNVKRVGSNISQGLKFSPKSVLQVRGCSASCFRRSDLEMEPGRCRRTDGKKWRCRRDVVTNQKYCQIHMHRGAKKPVKASQPAAFPMATPDVSSNTHLHSTVILPNEADHANLNTKLSILIPVSPQLMTIDDVSTMSSSSDTTISDTIIITN